MANTNQLNSELLSGLTEEERSLVLKTLADLSKGNNKGYEELIYEDYDEIPVDVETFLYDKNYLGNGLINAEGKFTVFPYWVETLKKIFPNNIDTAYNTLVLTGGIGLGKEQPISEPVLTENGFIPMGDIKIGTKVYSRDGKLCSVTGVFPQGIKDVYRVNFSDGSSTKCGLNHLWQITDHRVVKCHKTQPAETKVVDLKYLLSHNLRHGNQRRYSIPMCNPLEFEHKHTFISPYMMGCLLGDGCFRSQLRITSQDSQILNAFEEELSENEYTLTKQIHLGSKALDCKIVKKVKDASPNIYKEYLKSLGLWDKLSDAKFIPKEYLYNDVKSRIELLQGLLDTDGEATKSIRRCDNTYTYNIGYSTVSAQLKEDVVWLVQSLGGTASVRYKNNRKYHYKYNGADEYRDSKSFYSISIRLPLNIQPFRLDRKANLYNSCSHKNPVRYIDSIEKLDYQEESQCIMVDNEEHLYITNNFIVTHNTMMAMLCMAYLLHRMLCLKDPYNFYGLQPIDKITFSLINVTVEAAKGVGWDKIQQLFQSSPWFMSHGTISGRSDIIWTPNKRIELVVGSSNNVVIGRALYCLDGDTVIKTIDGDKKIRDLADKPIKVTSLDENQNEIFSDTCTVKPTICTNEEYQIELEDGTVIKCTGDHLFMLANGTYKAARDLTDEDELMDKSPDDYDRFISEIIERRGQWGIEGEYFEGHHIIPRCLGGQGRSKQKHSNIIRLYPAEHYEAHRLLLKKYPSNKQLKFAFIMMCIQNTGKYIVSAEEYADAKRWLSESLKNRIISDSTRAKLSESARKRAAISSERYRGRIAITDGRECRYIRKDELLPEGWKYGNNTNGHHPKHTVHRKHVLKDPESFKQQKRDQCSGSGNNMYGKGYKIAGGKNGKARTRYFFKDNVFECRKELVEYLCSQGLSITTAAIRTIESGQYGELFKRRYQAVIEGLKWEAKNAD